MAEGLLLVITRPPGGGFAKGDHEAFAVASQLAPSLGAALSCAVIGEDVEGAATEADERGATRVLTASGPAFGTPGDGLVAAATAAAAATDPAAILVPRGPDMLELTPRLATRLDGGAVTGATEVRTGDTGVEAFAAVFGGAARALYRFTASGPAVIGLAPVLLDPPDREAGRSGERIELDVTANLDRVRVIEPAVDTGVARIEDARVVVSGGRGLREADNFSLIRSLAANLGGMPGASRAIVDEGWAPPTEQVGLTGAIVTPDVYVAAGISGASQHMAGCSNSRLIVAINTDPDAPIFRYAHLGIVDDCLEVLPELLRLRGDAGAS
jgi:electron transfer flavoprotein alpha subunit